MTYNRDDSGARKSQPQAGMPVIGGSHHRTASVGGAGSQTMDVQSYQLPMLSVQQQKVNEGKTYLNKS